MDSLKPPEELKIQGGNLAERWERFLEQFEWYCDAIKAREAADRRRVGLLLTVAGKEAQEVYRTFKYAPARQPEGQPEVPAETREQYDTVVKNFENFVFPERMSFMKGMCSTPENKKKGRR